MNEKCSREMFYGAFLTFAFHSKPVLAASTIGFTFGCWDSPVKDFEAFNSAEDRRFHPVLDIFFALQNLDTI